MTTKAYRRPPSRWAALPWYRRWWNEFTEYLAQVWAWKQWNGY